MTPAQSVVGAVSRPRPTWDLRGCSAPWTRWELGLLAVLLVAGFCLRAHALATAGFADDEIHKWLAANRYLHGDFGGDDLEHPMLMKALIALCIAVLPRGIAPEALTRIPNVLASTAAIWAVAQLGRRLYGKPVGLLGAGLCALSTTIVGYSRIAKEDTLFALFLTLVIWCLAEACAAAADARQRDRARWEVLGAIFIGLAFASKYFVFVATLMPLTYAWVRRGTTWHVPLHRWVQLAAVGLAVMLVFDWVVLFPSTLEYIHRYLTGAHLGDRARSESYLFMGQLWDNLAFHWRHATPPYFLLVFAMVKLATPTAILFAAGMAIALVRRSQADRVLLTWVAFTVAVTILLSAKYGRYFIDMFAPCVLLPAMALVWLGELIREARARTAVLATCATVVLATEGLATLRHEPHPRLYINALGGGDARVDWFFPHCDYFDAGVRDAVERIARRAEPNAEIASEVQWLVRYYAGRDGRPDLVATPLISGRACAQQRTCYVIAQNGRHYWHNQRALDALAKQQPWSVVSVGGHRSVQIYRLSPDATLFPSADLAAKR